MKSPVIYSGSHSCRVLPHSTTPRPSPARPSPRVKSVQQPFYSVVIYCTRFSPFPPLPVPSRKALHPSREPCPPGDGSSGVKLSVCDGHFTAPHICCSSCRVGPAAPPWWPSQTLPAHHPWSWQNTPCSRRLQFERPCPDLPLTSLAPVGHRRKHFHFDSFSRNDFIVIPNVYKWQMLQPKQQL